MALAAIQYNYDVVNTAAKSIRSQHEPWAADVTVIASSAGQLTLAAAKAGRTIYVTRAVFNCFTPAAQSLSVTDEASPSFVTLLVVPATLVAGEVFEVDYGEMGTPATQESNVVLIHPITGLAGRFHIEGYYKRTAVGAPPTT